MDANDLDNSVSAEITRQAHELDAVRDTLTRSFSADQVAKWTRTAVFGPLLATHSIWGSVRWPKSLGKALVAPLAAGLTIECKVFQVLIEDVPDKPQRKHRLSLPDSPVLTWEMTSSEIYAVGFWSAQVPGKTHMVKVSLAPEVPWEQLFGPTQLTFRLIDPPSQEFEAVGATKVLPPFWISSAALRPTS